MPATPPRPFSTSTVASSIRARQSHSTLAAGVRARIARCPMPNVGVVSMVVSPAARRRNLLLWASRSLSSVVHDWPDAGTNCRSSVQIRHASGGVWDGGYWAPQAVQMKAAMRREYTVPRSRAPARAGWRRGSLKKANAPQLGTFHSSSCLLLIGPLQAGKRTLPAC